MKSGDREIGRSGDLEMRMRAARDHAYREAIKNLARYKFSNFGYYASRWVTLNRIIGDKQPNPFRNLVEGARMVIFLQDHPITGSPDHQIAEVSA